MRVNDRDHAENILALSELVIEEDLCINLRGRMMHCTNCRDACPSDALSLTPDSIDLDHEKCTGCNSCLQSCSAGALRSTGFVPERFIRGHSGQEEIHLYCRASAEDGGGIVIPCHAVLDARLLAASRAEGVKTITLHGLSNCVNCRMGDARAHIESVCSTLQDWMGEYAPVVDAFPRNDTQSGVRQYQDQPHMSRRTFLKSAGAKTFTRAVEWMVPGLDREEQDDEAIPFYQAGDYPQRPSQYQQVLASRVHGVPWQDKTVLPWKNRALADNCSGCLSCGERCPTGALQARETTDVRQLSFDIAYCTDCGLCERICPESAMISNFIRKPESVGTGRSVLLHLRQCQCHQCGVPFIPDPPDVTVCPVCSNELDLDEEWLEMLSG